MNFSIASSAYNLEKMGFSWRDTLSNWFNFLDGQGEIVIAVNTSEDGTADLIRKHFEKIKESFPIAQTALVILETAFSYEDPEFDGKIKNAAFKGCRQEFIIQLDFDEVLPLWTRDAWIQIAVKLNSRREEAAMVPVLDIFKNEESYKSLGQKWYLTKNKPYLKRGVVNFARKGDGKIDITKSDTCELLYDNGELVQSVYLIDPRLPEWMNLGTIQGGDTPLVIHLGYLNLEQRLRQNEFWKPHWENRAGHEVNDIAQKLADFDKIEVKEHGLKHWNNE